MALLIFTSVTLSQTSAGVARPTDIWLLQAYCMYCTVCLLKKHEDHGKTALNHTVTANYEFRF